MKRSNEKTFWFTMIFMLVSFLCYRWSLADRFPNYDVWEERQLRQFVDAHGTYAISYQQSIRYNTPDEIDATNMYLYLDYGSSNCVDVYTLDGNFLYSFLLPDEKGGVDIRCVDNQVYISDSKNNLYVFEGTTEISRMRPEDAVIHGYDYSWFQEKELFQKIEGEKFLKYDVEGKCVMNLDIPQNPHVSNPLRGAIFLGSLFIWIIVLIKDLINRPLVS